MGEILSARDLVVCDGGRRPKGNVGLPIGMRLGSSADMRVWG